MVVTAIAILTLAVLYTGYSITSAIDRQTEVLEEAE